MGGRFTVATVESSRAPEILPRGLDGLPRLV